MKNYARILALKTLEPDSDPSREYIDQDPDAMVERRETELQAFLVDYANNDSEKYSNAWQAIFNLVCAHQERACESGVYAGAQLMLTLATDQTAKSKKLIAQLMKGASTNA